MLLTDASTLPFQIETSSPSTDVIRDKESPGAEYEIGEFRTSTDLAVLDATDVCPAVILKRAIQAIGDVPGLLKPSFGQLGSSVVYRIITTPFQA